MRRLISLLSILLLMFLLLLWKPAGAQDSTHQIRERVIVVHSDQELAATFNPMVHEVTAIELSDGNVMLSIRLKK